MQRKNYKNLWRTKEKKEENNNNVSSVKCISLGRQRLSHARCIYWNNLWLCLRSFSLTARRWRWRCTTPRKPSLERCTRKWKVHLPKGPIYAWFCSEGSQGDSEQKQSDDKNEWKHLACIRISNMFVRLWIRNMMVTTTAAAAAHNQFSRKTHFEIEIQIYWQLKCTQRMLFECHWHEMSASPRAPQQPTWYVQENETLWILYYTVIARDVCENASAFKCKCSTNGILI